MPDYYEKLMRTVDAYNALNEAPSRNGYKL